MSRSTCHGLVNLGLVTPCPRLAMVFHVKRETVGYQAGGLCAHPHTRGHGGPSWESTYLLWLFLRYIFCVSKDWLACGGGPRLAFWHLKSLAVALPLPLFQANFSGEVTAEVAVSSSMVYSIAHMEKPSILCVAGSSSNIDICAPGGGCAGLSQ